MRLNNTFAALNNSIVNQKETNKSLNNLSSGLRINKASDDASGLAIADKLRTHASGIKQGIENANSGLAMLNIADKAMSEMSNILDIIKSKSIQMATATTSEEGKKIIKTEILKLLNNFDSIVDQTNYNSIKLLTGENTPFDFHVGNRQDSIIRAEIDSLSSSNIGENDPYKLSGFNSGFNNISTTSPLNNEIGLVGNTGVVRVNFSWQEDVDIDPVVIEPGGDAIGHHAGDFDSDGPGVDNTTVNGGIRDVDDLGNGSGLVDNPNQENYYWATTAPNGQFEYRIRNVDSFTTTDPIDITVSIKSGNALVQQVVTIPVGTLDIGPFKFNYNGSKTNNENIFRDDTDLTSQARELMRIVDSSINQLNSIRGNIGSAFNQIESSVRNSMADYVNTKNAESIIRDVDYAQESSNFSKLNIIGQAGSFAQTKQNETQQRVLELLK